MKKTLKRTLSVILAAVLLLGLGVTAFAGTEEEADPIVVTGIGDSIGNGYSQDWNCEKTINGSPYNNNNGFGDIVYMSPQRQKQLYPGLYYPTPNTPVFCTVKGYIDEPNTEADYANNAALIKNYETRTLRAFPAQVAAELNGYHVTDFNSFAEYYDVVPYNSLTTSGLRAKDLRYILDPEYKTELDAAIADGTLDDPLWDYFSFVRDDGRTITKSNIDNQIDAADVLIVEIGGNDVFTTALANTDILSGNADLNSLLPAFIERLSQYIPQAIENYNWTLDYALAMNPDATVVLVGIYDYYLDNDLSNYSLDLSEDMLSLIMDACIGISALFNANLRDYADTHENVYYVDTNQTQTISYETQSGDSIHPSLEGHDYIARRILSVLPNSLKNRYDITVDLFGVYEPGKSSVISVSVDGKAVTDYELNGYELTIHCRNGNAKLVNIITTDGSKIKNITWQASYNKTDGYRTYQIAKVTDELSTAKTVATKVTTAAKTLLSKLKK